MPIYEYRCEDGHSFEVIQKMADDPISVCEVCGKPVQRVFHPVAVHYKGSGFYSTDYGKKRSGAASDSGSSDSDSSSDSAGKSESSSEKKSDSKSSDSSSGDKKKSDSKPSD